jgi:type IV fimbrial biogenesis protein FimT
VHLAGLTLIEVLIGIALLVIVLALVAPSVRDLIAAQRVRSINAELVTDLQYARSEAVRRSTPVLVSFRSGTGSSCYSLSVGEVCNCLLGIGRACVGPDREIKTVSVSRRIGVELAASGSIVFDPTGLPNTPAFDVTVSSPERGALRTTTNATGRPSVCAPGGAFREVPPCP